jgi:TRAP-type C4-dicarboxylate transport system substrate-binding protein
MVLHARQVAARRPFGWRIAAAIAVATAFAAAPSQAQQITMKFATQTINDVQHEFIKVYKTELEKATNGRVQVCWPSTSMVRRPSCSRPR